MKQCLSHSPETTKFSLHTVHTVCCCSSALGGEAHEPTVKNGVLSCQVANTSFTDSTDLSSDAYDLAKENTSLHSGLMHLSAQGQNEHQSWTNENIESFSAVGGCLFFGK